VIDAVITSAFVHAASRLLGESPPAVERALRGAIPALLSGIAGHASDKGAPGGKVSRIIESATVRLDLFPGIVDDRETAVAYMRTGSEMIRDIFGVRSRRLIEAVARYAGISDNSAASLLSLSAPIVVDALRQYEENTDLPASLKWLGEQRNAIAQLLPPDISTMTGLGGGLLRAGGAARTVAAPRIAAPVRSRTPAVRLRKRLILAGLAVLGLLLAVGGAYLTHGTKGPSGPGMVTLSLPNQTVIEVPAVGVHRALYDYLAGKGDRNVPRAFACEHIDFYRDSSRLTPSSLGAVDSLAAILNAYPRVHFRLDGFVSQQGDEDSRKQVALDRTNAVAARLEADGVEAHRMESGVYTAQQQPGPGESPLRLVITTLE
jgi:OmpA-OmpF porin, OOP family